jgi:putative alpha-1,2-mannosidase
MSAWYLFSAMGFYPGKSASSPSSVVRGHANASLPLETTPYSRCTDPSALVVDPASATYVIGAPYFDSLTLRLPGARRRLRVTARGASNGAKYVRSVTIDGKPHRDIIITHEQIRDGADIVFDMQQTPQVWGK